MTFYALVEYFPYFPVSTKLVLTLVRIGQVDTLINEVEQFLANKKASEADSPTVQQIKRIIREAEAVSGIQPLDCGANKPASLTCPSTKQGKSKKNPPSPA